MRTVIPGVHTLREIFVKYLLKKIEIKIKKARDGKKQAEINRRLFQSCSFPLLICLYCLVFIKVAPVRPSTIPSPSNGPFKHHLHKNVIQNVLKCSVVNN